MLVSSLVGRGEHEGSRARQVTSDLHRWRSLSDGLPLYLPIVQRCAFCDFRVEAPLEEARQAFADHVCDRPMPATKRKASGFRFGHP
jgi:hypothetical protein